MVCQALRNVCDSVWVYVIDLLHQCYDGHNALCFRVSHISICTSYRFFSNDRLVINVFILLPAVWTGLAPFELWANSSFIEVYISLLQ